VVKKEACFVAPQLAPHTSEASYAGWAEETLLRVGHAYEQATEWH